MAIRSQSLTFEDLERIRETRQERLELIAGELFVTPSPTPVHQFVSARLLFLFMQKVRELGYGLVFNAPLDVHLAKNTIVQPDLIVVLPDRRPIVTSASVEGAPSLVVEILSPATRGVDQTTNRHVYARYGVPEYWLVDTETRTVTVCSEPQMGRFQVERVTREIAVSEILPGLSADLTELCAPIPDV